MENCSGTPSYLKSQNSTSLCPTCGVNPAKVHVVILNGADFGVTDNLMYFLRREQPQEPQLDAIRINQSDNVGKSGQVQRMREIYKNAAVVHAELGPASEDEERVVPRVQRLDLCVSAERRRVKSENNGVVIYDHVIYDQTSLPFMEPYKLKVWGILGARIIWHAGPAKQ